MLNEIKEAIERSAPNLPGDFAGAMALVAMFVVALHLPVLT